MVPSLTAKGNGAIAGREDQMIASIRDKRALSGVSPGALSAYVCTSGWRKTDTCGDHSDVYTGEELPEIILPRHQKLGDYASVVSRLLEISLR